MANIEMCPANIFVVIERKILLESGSQLRELALSTRVVCFMHCTRF